MDLTSMTLAGLFAIGVVNVITFFRPDLDNKIKFALAFLAAFIALFVPAELGNEVLNKAKLALEVAFASSGTYKLFGKIGTA